MGFSPRGATELARRSFLYERPRKLKHAAQMGVKLGKNDTSAVNLAACCKSLWDRLSSRSIVAGSDGESSMAKSGKDNVSTDVHTGPSHVRKVTTTSNAAPRSAPTLDSEAPKRIDSVLGIVAGTTVGAHESAIFAHSSFGRVVEGLCHRYRRVLLCAPTRSGQPMAFHDHRIMADNLTALPQPYYPTTLRALRHLLGIAIAMWRTCRRSDVLFVRGSVPYVGVLYAIATLLGKRIHYWAVGDPAALLRSHRRSGRVKDMLSLIYAIMDSYTVRFGHFVNRGAIFANGDEIARLFPSSRTHTVVSSTILDEEFFERADTCTGNTVRILCLSMIRPEKGIEYLIGALDLLQTERNWEVVIVGSWDAFEDYKTKLDRVIADSPQGERVRWAGYAEGSEVLAHMRNADVFVLPTLSEGTPRVLVEARAQSLPIVSTRVGGIATSVSDGVDGLLVAPKNPGAIALAVDRIIDDAPLRRRLIANGLARARTLTLDRFLERILAVMGNEPT